MGLPAVQFSVEFKEHCCWSCDLRYYVPATWSQKRRENHDTFYCPQGHPAYFPQDNETEKLRKELEKAERARQMALETARMEAEQRKKVERKLKTTSKKLARVENGVCPECNRSFTNVARHMQTKHGVKCNQPPKGAVLKGRT